MQRFFNVKAGGIIICTVF